MTEAERRRLVFVPLSQMASETAALEAHASGGIECRKCGCRDLRVQTTRRGDGVIVRYRVCRHCGQHRPTIEF